jgi:hypothetical protein
MGLMIEESIEQHLWAPGGGQAKTFSGHESFPCRYGWLPKLYEAVEADPEIFTSDERAILTLGLGRNMVKALRFWGDVFGLLCIEKGRARNTHLARRLLDPNVGLDPYLEDRGSLWRLHWQVTAHAGLGAWVAAFLDLQDLEIARDRLVELVRNKALTSRGAITSGTAIAHVDMLVRTYDWARISDAAPGEDASGCTFQELHLIESGVTNGNAMVKLPRGTKPDLDLGAFAYALHDFWTGTAPTSQTLSMRSLLLERRSPGMVFRLDETALHQMLEAVSHQTELDLREDGVGGLDLVAGSAMGMHELGRLAWPVL